VFARNILQKGPNPDPWWGLGVQRITAPQTVLPPTPEKWNSKTTTETN